MQVEIQYRTVYQHAWATSVEIAGALTGSHTKFDRGQKEHKLFFLYASEIIARCYENSKGFLPDLSNSDLLKLFNAIEKKIRLLNRLESIRMVKGAITAVEHLKGKNLILIAQEGQSGVRIKHYTSLVDATAAYFEFEKNASATDDIVLVRAETHENINQAFKNYFSDTSDFVYLMQNGLKKLAANA